METPVTEHVHNWRHLGGPCFGMYRCDQGPDPCWAMGYSRVYRGPCTNQNIVPYSCTQCGGWAVAKDVIPHKYGPPAPRPRREWRCKNHRVPAKETTHAA